MKSKQVAYLAIVAVLLVLGLAWFLRSDYESVDTTAPIVDDIAEEFQEASSSPPDTAPGDSSPAPAEASLSAPSQMDLTRQASWERERGYMSEERMNLRSLDEEQLQVLISQGNTAAITTLASRNLTTNPQKMMELYQQAAVLGNTAALVSASSAWASPSITQSVATMRVSEDNPPVNMLATLLVAQLRGDNVLAPQQLQQLRDDFDFTEEMIQEACAGAQRLYEDLEAKRLASGQNYFDNTPSPLGQQYEEGNHTSATCGEQ